MTHPTRLTEPRVPARSQHWVGYPRRGIYDNMKTAVKKVSKGRTVNARVMVMCSHYLFDPYICNVASGWRHCTVLRRCGSPGRSDRYVPTAVPCAALTMISISSFSTVQLLSTNLGLGTSNLMIAKVNKKITAAGVLLDSRLCRLSAGPSQLQVSGACNETA